MFGVGPYGTYWQKMRKITRELLTVHHIEMFEHLRISEIKESVGDIYDFWLKNRGSQSHMVKIDINQWLGCLTQNIVLRTIVGKRYEWNDKKGIQFSERIRTVTEQVGSFYLRDYVSFLRWLDWGGPEKAMQEAAKETDRILTECLGEHKLRRKAKDEQHDIMDMILTRMDKATSPDFEGFDPDTVVKATSLTFISGAADSTRMTLSQVVFLLISNPHVLQKARDELNNHVGRNRQVEESDIKNLVYLQAIIKESMRLHPSSQLLPPRESVEDCEIGGYNIPKDTLLIANLSKIHRDPQVWPNPDEFQPERFLTSHQNVDVMGNHYELLPFGSGRRRCPGIFFGLRLVQIALATIIHRFELEKASDEPDDKSAAVGLRNSIPQFKILLKPITSAEK
ncbi:cytochrome P450 CYP82D47 [Daucus carota subsp. sativus]|uniref:cytochrome P450 CYP82D47 n=1 Tax=Daucus carota subsp. sativus TaxID=79200 RepID=UPI003082D860